MPISPYPDSESQHDGRLYRFWDEYRRAGYKKNPSMAVIDFRCERLEDAAGGSTFTVRMLEFFEALTRSVVLEFTGRHFHLFGCPILSAFPMQSTGHANDFLR